MSKKRWAAMAAAGVALITAFSIAAMHADAKDRAAASEIPQYLPLPAAAYDAAGVRLDTRQGLAPLVGQIASDAALTAAKAAVGAVADEASAVTVSFGNFSDDSYFTTDAAGVKQYAAQNVPAYVVSFSGLSLASHGMTSARNTEENVVVDALTGAIVETFSYR